MKNLYNDYKVKFSIVIPCYNRSETILPSLKSVQDQTYGNFECIVVDDGSKDAENLQETIKRLDDDRFRYIWRKNGGGGAARNTGIDAATGEYIAFLNSDDLFNTDKLMKFSEVVNSSPMTAYYSKVNVDRGVNKMWARPDRSIRHNEDMGEYLFVSNQVIQTSSIVIAAETAKRVRFDPSLRKGQDLDFCVRLHAADVRFKMLDEPLAVWTDQSEANRTSRHAGYEAPIAWLERSDALLTKKAQLGYRATVLAYYLAKERPFEALRDLAKGLFLARVPPKVIARQFLRCFIPRDRYRQLVNSFVALRGS